MKCKKCGSFNTESLYHCTTHKRCHCNDCGNEWDHKFKQIMEAERIKKLLI